MVKEQWESDVDQENDEELQQLLEGLEAEERERQKQVLIVVAILTVVVGAGAWWMFSHSEELFRPAIDPEAGERELALETGDPNCRQLMADIEGLHDAFLDHELEFAEHVWGDDEEVLRQLRGKAQEMRSGFDELEELLEEAVFREEEARGDEPVEEQVENWMGYQENEYRILEEMADKRLRMLAGDEVEDRGYLWEEPRNLRDKVLMQIDDNFEEFRVWKASGGHPCGAPPEGVEPWVEGESP